MHHRFLTTITCKVCSGVVGTCLVVPANFGQVLDIMHLQIATKQRAWFRVCCEEKLPVHLSTLVSHTCAEEAANVEELAATHVLLSVTQCTRTQQEIQDA